MLQQAAPPSFSMYERMIVPYNEGANPFFERCHHAAENIHEQVKKPRACPASSGIIIRNDKYGSYAALLQ